MPNKAYKTCVPTTSSYTESAIENTVCPDAYEDVKLCTTENRMGVVSEMFERFEET